MKFRDIKKFFTPIYSIDIPLSMFTEKINEYTKEYGLQLNPDFQRGHVWTEEQQIAFIEYLLRGGKTGKDLYFNHVGWNRMYKGEFVCVDGLQRITAILRFMNNEIRAFGALLSEFEDKLPWSDYNMKIHINNLKDRKDVLQWYIDFNEGGTPHTKDEINRVKQLMEHMNDQVNATK